MTITFAARTKLNEMRSCRIGYNTYHSSSVVRLKFHDAKGLSQNAAYSATAIWKLINLECQKQPQSSKNKYIVVELVATSMITPIV